MTDFFVRVIMPNRIVCRSAICLLLALAVGCGWSSPAAKSEPAHAGHDHAEHEGDSHEGHAHADHGSAPHGGTIADWGSGVFHVELTVDHDKQEAVVYVLGSDAKTPAQVTAGTVLLTINAPEFQVDLAPQPLSDDSDGQSSRYVGRHSALGKVQTFAGTISGLVAGTPYAGDFDENATGGNKH